MKAVLTLILVLVVHIRAIAQDTAHHNAGKGTWIRYIHYDSLYSVEVPGVPVDYEKVGESLHMRGYFDSSCNKGYFCSVFNTFQTIPDKDAMVKDLVKRLKSKGKVVSSTKIEKQGLKGREVIFPLQDSYAKAKIFVAKRLVFTILVVAKRPEQLADADSTHFLDSLDIRALAMGFMP